MRLIKVMLFILLSSSAAWAQEADEPAPISWQEGPIEGKMADVSTINLPEGYYFLGPEDTKRITEAMGNISTGREIGMINCPSNNLTAFFEFDPIGYVKDDEKDELDPVTMLQTHKEGQEHANEVLRQRGLPELEVVGWIKEPFYNEETQNLEWCLSVKKKGTEEIFANHNVRILGRHGVTEIVVPADINELNSIIPELAKILEGYEYQEGNRYAEFKKGDKIAKYGLTALVAGGAAAVALKSGLLKPILKWLGIAAVAMAGFLRKLFRRNKSNDEN